MLARIASMVALVVCFGQQGCGTRTFRPDAEFVGVGRIETILLIPREHPRCEGPCPAGAICVFNSCGCAEGTVEIDDEISHRNGPHQLTLHENLGEWCDLPFTPGERVLVKVTPTSKTLWSLLVLDDGEWFFSAEDIPTLFGVPTSETADADSRVNVESIRR